MNFVNVTGEIDLVSATNSFSDALDVDFSELKINEIKIISALNDCTDFSSGNYILGSLTLKNSPNLYFFHNADLKAGKIPIALKTLIVVISLSGTFMSILD